MLVLLWSCKRAPFEELHLHIVTGHIKHGRSASVLLTWTCCTLTLAGLFSATSLGHQLHSEAAQPAGKPSTTGRCMKRNANMMLSPVTRLPTALLTLTPTAVSLPHNIAVLRSSPSALCDTLASERHPDHDGNRWCQRAMFRFCG